MPQLLSNAELLARLVAFDSSSTSSSRPLAEFVASYVDRPGIEVLTYPEHSPEQITLLLRAGPKTDDRDGLLFNGHLDVVPAEPEGWRSDPFKLVERNGTLVGRGACDMKASVALALNALASLEVDRLRRPLALLLTWGEELGSLGAQQFAREFEDVQHLPRKTIVGEPTSLRVVRMHKGHLKARLTFRGRAAHSGFPHLGRNAVEAAGRAIHALGDLRRELESERTSTSEFFPDTPYPALNVARVAGGGPLNVIPDHAKVELGVRLLPGMQSAPIVERLRSVAEAAARNCDGGFELINDNPPMLLDASAPINRALCGLIGQTESRGVPFSSDAGVLQRDLGCECVLFGPGSIDVAHRPNEYVPIDEFERAGRVLRELIHTMCIDEEAT